MNWKIKTVKIYMGLCNKTNYGTTTTAMLCLPTETFCTNSICECQGTNYKDKSCHNRICGSEVWKFVLKSYYGDAWDNPNK